MRDDWKPLVHAACVAADNRFAIAFGEFEYEDPFFVLIDYDGSASQPWARRDAKREMSTVIALNPLYIPRAKYAALSREGDIYFIADSTSTERIVGAGLSSPDSLQLGELFDLALIDNKLWAVGARGQFYTRTATGWHLVATKSFEAMNFGQANLGRIVGTHEQNIYLSYSLPPDEAVIPDDVRKKLADNGSWDDWNEAYARAEEIRSNKILTRGLLHWDGRSLTQVVTPLSPDGTIDVLYIDNDGRIYLAGDAGVIVAGNLSKGFSVIASSIPRSRIISIVNFKGTTYFATSNGLMKIEKQTIENVYIPFDDPHPLKISCSENMLFYFDRRAKIALFDGKKWSEVTLPSALLERDFRTL